MLFLDELPEFPRTALEALREPLETGQICISRATSRAEFPARFQFIAAMNPCPCGFNGSKLHACRCSPDQVARYQGKLSGPLLDRIDLHVEVPSLAADDLLRAPQGESSQAMRERCAGARKLAVDRQGVPNNVLSGKSLDAQAGLDESTSQFLGRAGARLGWSARSTHRVLRVARTVADLAGEKRIQVAHIAEAIQYRRGVSAGQ